MSASKTNLPTTKPVKDLLPEVLNRAALKGATLEQLQALAKGTGIKKLKAGTPDHVLREYLITELVTNARERSKTNTRHHRYRAGTAMVALRAHADRNLPGQPILPDVQKRSVL